MAATILHISDLHFGDPKSVLNRIEVGSVISNLLAKAGPDVLLVLSGDISFKGCAQGYTEARAALLPALETSGIPRNRIIVCPGNHDVVISATGTLPFGAFDVWSAGLRNDGRCTFSDTSCRFVRSHGTNFLLINSAYHCDINYGLVNLQELDLAIASMGAKPVDGPPRVAVLHHHLIPFSGQRDTSTIRNAYQVLTRLINAGFSLVLHGHQHALLELGVGECLMKLYGVGSFRYHTPGFVNGASIYRINEQNSVSAERYVISKDAPDFLRTFTNS
jgi:3',5'-cyclic AMP phosphodiesterase CpdA